MVTERPQRKWWSRPEVGAAAAFVVVLGLRLLTGSDLIDAVINAAWLAAASYGVVRWRWHSDAKRLKTSPEEIQTADEWIQKEEVPEDPEQRRLLADVVEQRRGQMTRRHAQVAIGLFFAVFLASAVLMLLTGDTGLALMMAGLCAAIGGIAFFTRRKALGKLAKVEHLLAQPPATPGTRAPLNASGTPAAPRTPSPRTADRPGR